MLPKDVRAALRRAYRHLCGLQHVSADSNPLRPIVYATALWDATGAVSPVQASRAILLRLAAGVAAGLIYGGTTGAAAGEDNAEAAQLVKAMTDYLQTLEAFSVKVDVGTDVVLKTGQKHKLNSSGEVLVRRPGALRVTRKGELADAEFNFDGKTLSILSRSDNVYFQADAPGTIDDLVDELGLALDAFEGDARGAHEERHAHHHRRDRRAHVSDRAVVPGWVDVEPEPVHHDRRGHVLRPGSGGQ